MDDEIKKLLNYYQELSIPMYESEAKKFKKNHPELIDTNQLINTKVGNSINMERYSRYCLNLDLDEVPYIINNLNSNFNYIFKGFYRKLTYFEPFRRLFDVKQWGTIQTIPWAFVANHTRAAHSLITAAITNIVLTINNFDDQTIKLGIAAGLCHDIAMPALSDFGKKLDRNKLDEEKNIDLILKTKEATSFFKKYNLDVDEIISYIRGEHQIIGPLINSKNGIDLDNISYLLLDHSRIRVESPNPTNHIYSDLETLAQAPSKPFNAYLNLKYNSKNQSWGFTDKNQIKDLLYIRTLLYKRIFCSAWNRSFLYVSASFKISNGIVAIISS